MSKLRVVVLVLSICIAGWVSISVYEAFRTTSDQIKLVSYDEYFGKMLAKLANS